MLRQWTADSLEFVWTCAFGTGHPFSRILPSWRSSDLCLTHFSAGTTLPACRPTDASVKDVAGRPEFKARLDKMRPVSELAMP